VTALHIIISACPFIDVYTAHPIALIGYYR
jgi:hypothetical protein